MPGLERHQSSQLATVTSGLTRRDEIRTGRSLSALRGRTLLRVANVQAEGMVQTEKLNELDNLGRVATTGHAMLVKYADVAGGGDPLLRDELKFFSDIVRFGKGEVIADTIDTFCRESRR